MPNEPFSEYQLNLINTTYGLDVVKQELPEWKTATNHVVILQDKQGMKYVAKMWGNGYPQEIIKSRLRIMDFIYDHGILTPKLLKNLVGTKLTKSNGNNYTLTTFIPGRKIKS